MELRCRCPGCSAKFKVDGKYAGKKARCPKCQAVVAVPLQNNLDESTTSLSQLAPARPPDVSGSQVVSPQPGVKTTTIPVVSQPPPPPAAPPIAAPEPVPDPAVEGDAFASAGPALPMFVTTKPAVTGTAAQGKTGDVHRAKHPSAALLIAGGTLAGALAVALTVALYFGMQGFATQGSAGSGKRAKTVAKGAKTQLVLDWPAADRRGGSISIDGTVLPLPASGPVKFALKTGRHQVLLQRRGYEPIDVSFALASGEEEHLTPAWKPASVASATPTAPMPPGAPSADGFPIGSAVGSTSVKGFDGWLQNLELAGRKATQAKQDILIVFGCSDAQQATQELARQLDQAGVKTSHVCLVIDYPETEEGYNLIEDRGQNEQLALEFGIDTFPVLALADAAGRTYFLKKQWPDGLANLQARIVEWTAEKQQRDELLAAATQGSESEQLAAAIKAVKWLQDKFVWRFYEAELARWMAAAQRVDPQNEQALLEVFFEPQWFLHLVRVNKQDAAALAGVASQLDPWVGRKFKDPDRGAKLHMQAAYALAIAEQFDLATTHVESAVTYHPRDAQLAEALEDVKRRLQDKDVLGNGTGFLIAPGYILTNQHVVEGPGRVAVRLPDAKEPVPAEVIAQDASRDVALLKVTLPDAAKYKPLPVAPGGIGRGKGVAAFGFPLGSALGSGLKFTQGGISALPDAENQNMYVVDIRINRGNSGGPLCDPRGNVVGMITAKTGNFGFDDSYALAIPAEHLIAFLDRHLPKAQERAAANDGQPLTWDQVDQQVSSGVFMILKLR